MLQYSFHDQISLRLIVTLQCTSINSSCSFSLLQYLRPTQLKVLLAYLDLPVFQAMVTALNMETATYSGVKNFLQTRYSTHDAYMERLNFFESKFSIPADSYAASLFSLMDKFSADAAQLREEILVAKFISSCKDTLSSELRLQRPTTLNDCIKITNSLSTVMSSSACAVASSKPCNMNKRHQKPVPKRMCFHCGDENHITSETTCPQCKMWQL